MTISPPQHLNDQQPPPVPEGSVPRPQACALLDLAFHQRVTMVVAPPGFGKTELLAQWAATQPAGRVRWVTVTPEHAERGRLMVEMRHALTAGGSRAGDVALVLDDFHHVTDGALAAIIDSAPARVHVILVSRVDPPTPFHRLGSRDLRVELRDDALALTHDEGTALVRRTVTTALTPAELDARLQRADGWAVGLRLGDDEARLAEYLDAQVLAGLPPDVLDFLRTTSVLREMTGPLCDWVLEQPGGDAMLDRLRRSSLFVGRREGSDRLRYHPQFRTRLRALLHEQDPGFERHLLVRAARWHLARDEFDPGMAYLIEAAAWDDAFAAAFAHGPRLLRRGEATAVARWLAQVPMEIRATRPDVLLLEAAGRLFGNEPTRAGDLLDTVERSTPPESSDRLVAAMLRGYAALQRGAVWQAVAASDRIDAGLEATEGFDGPNVLGLTGSRRDLAAAAGVLRGVGFVYEGRLADARQSLEPAIVGTHAVWQVSALGALALLEAWSGRLAVGEQLAFQALATAEEVAMIAEPMTTSALLAVAIVAREREDLLRARAFLDEATRRSGPGQSRLVAGAVDVEEALLAAANGDPHLGLRRLAARHDTDHPSTPPAVVVRRRAVVAQLLLLTGDLDGAEQALDAAPRAEAAEVAAVRMRVAIERGDLATARVISAAWPDEATPRSTVLLRLWTAVLEYLGGNEGAARDEMAAAVRVAEADSDLGPFRFAGAHVLGPARALYRSTPTPFVRAIVEQPAPPVTVRVSSHLVEQLTHREYLVLSLLPTRLSNAEIAERLEVSLNTVKTHLKHIYRKLDVPGRREAVGSAEKLRLL